MKLLGKIRDCAFIALLALCLILVPVTIAGCTASQAEAAVQKVIADMPTVLNIAESVLVIVSAAKGMTPAQLATLQGEATNYDNAAVTDLKTIDGVLTAYQSGLANASPTILNELDSAVSAVNVNLTNLESDFKIADPASQAAVAAVVGSLGAFLLGVQTLISAPAVAIAMPHTALALKAAGIQPGSGTYAIPSSHKLAKDFNGKVAAILPQAKVHVPWMRVPKVEVPIWP